MIHTKRVIFMILPLLFVPLVYGMSSTPDACAAPRDPNFGSASAVCSSTYYLEPQRKNCCWEEPDILNPGESIIWCQTCNEDGTNCGPVHSQPPSPTGPFTPPQGDVEQPEQPPLFGRNEEAVPPTGGILQPFAPAPGFQQIPQGQVQPFIQSENPPTLTPTPLPTPPSPLPPLTPTGPTVAPQDDEGGGLPATQNQENVPLDGGAAEQPEDNGQEETSEGEPTAGPLT
jgi:hypothetical protein